jgi:hypothetical protein
MRIIVPCVAIVVALITSSLSSAFETSAKDARLKVTVARKLAIEEARRSNVPANRITGEESPMFHRDDGQLWWVFYFAPPNPGPGEFSHVLVNDRTREVRFMGGK